MSLENPFWTFALKVYKDPQVQSLCLDWQSLGLSVNRVLFCCWLADEATQLEAWPSMPSADLWQRQTLEPLRRLRYQVKSSIQTDPCLEPLYQTLQQAELQAEQREIAYLWQARLHQAPFQPAHDSPAALARQNLQVYFQQSLPKGQALAENQVHQLVDRIFPSV